MNETSKWIIGTFLTVATALTAGAYKVATEWSAQSKELGRIESDNSHLSLRNAELSKEIESLKGQLDAFRGSTNTSQSEVARLKDLLQRSDRALELANAAVSRAENRINQLAMVADSSTRCAPYRKEISDLEEELAGGTLVFVEEKMDPARKAELNNLIAQQHETLRKCLEVRL